MQSVSALFKAALNVSHTKVTEVTCTTPLGQTVDLQIKSGTVSSSGDSGCPLHRQPQRHPPTRCRPVRDHLHTRLTVHHPPRHRVRQRRQRARPLRRVRGRVRWYQHHRRRHQPVAGGPVATDRTVPVFCPVHARLRDLDLSGRIHHHGRCGRHSGPSHGIGTRALVAACGLRHRTGCGTGTVPSSSTTSPTTAASTPTSTPTASSRSGCSRSSTRPHLCGHSAPATTATS